MLRKVKRKVLVGRVMLYKYIVVFDIVYIVYHIVSIQCDDSIDCTIDTQIFRIYDAMDYQWETLRNA